jgi:hypothetical protein
MKHTCEKCQTTWEEDVTIPSEVVKTHEGSHIRKIITCPNCEEKYVFIPDDDDACKHCQECANNNCNYN